MITCFSTNRLDNQNLIASNLPALTDAKDIGTFARPQRIVNDFQPSYGPNNMTDDDRVPLTGAAVQIRFDNPVFGEGEDETQKNKRDFMNVLAHTNENSDDDYSQID